MHHVIDDFVSFQHTQENNQRLIDARAPLPPLTATYGCSCPSAASSPCVCRRARTLAAATVKHWKYSILDIQRHYSSVSSRPQLRKRLPAFKSLVC